MDGCGRSLVEGGRPARPRHGAIDARGTNLRPETPTGSPVDHRRRAAQAELRDLPDRTASTTLAPDGVTIPFADGHTRRLPCSPPARSVRDATRPRYLDAARPYANAAAQAGRDLRLGAEPALPARTASTGTRGTRSSTTSSTRPRRDIRGCLEAGARQRPDRLHRGTAGAEARPVRRAAAAASSI